MSACGWWRHQRICEISQFSTEIKTNLVPTFDVMKTMSEKLSFCMQLWVDSEVMSLNGIAFSGLITHSTSCRQSRTPSTWREWPFTRNKARKSLHTEKRNFASNKKFQLWKHAKEKLLKLKGLQRVTFQKPFLYIDELLSAEFKISMTNSRKMTFNGVSRKAGALEASFMKTMSRESSAL